MLVLSSGELIDDFLYLCIILELTADVVIALLLYILEAYHTHVKELFL